MLTPDTTGDMETVMAVDEKSMAYRRRVYSNPTFQAVARKVLPYFDRKGILDEMF